MTIEARRLGVGGWVRNRRDGMVEAVVCGDSAAVAAIIAWASRGPAGARVDHVDVSIAPAEPDPGFEATATV